jgi:hypothetical protein
MIDKRRIHLLEIEFEPTEMLVLNTLSADIVILAHPAGCKYGGMSIVSFSST